MFSHIISYMIEKRLSVSQSVSVNHTYTLTYLEAENNKKIV